MTLSGELTRSVGSYVVQLGSTLREPVLIVLRNPNPYPVGTRLEVTGQIRTFTPARLETELGIELGAEVNGFNGQRCLVAAIVRRL